MLNDLVREILHTLFETGEINFLLALILGLVSGFAIGTERELRNKDAGISTHMMVITGAMLFTLLSTSVDPASKSRIAAQVVTGIGFLGAGLILKEQNTVRNLTTAASLWVAAAVGMAYGFGYFATGIAVTIAIIFIPRIPHIGQRRERDRNAISKTEARDSNAE